MAEVLERDRGGAELRADATSLAPERLLVFELRGAIQTFINAVRHVPGLELLDEEEIAGDEQDENPVVYLLISDAQALKSIVSLWHRWSRGEEMDQGFTPWRDVFATLRDIRPWGPKDRIDPEDRSSLLQEMADNPSAESIRIEVELVFRASETLAGTTEIELKAAIESSGGRIVSRCRVPDIGYHAVLAELPVQAVRSILEMSAGSIANFDPVMHIRPQSVASVVVMGDAENFTGEVGPAIDRTPILAILDGVPVAQHPLLAGTLVLDDQFGLEAHALVGDRHHGTAMASLIMHGDRNKVEARLPRRIHITPVLGAQDKFPDDRLIIDLIYLAIVRMREGVAASAPEVLIVNMSLGNVRRPFHGQMSAWARLIDRLAYRFGILFVISAGNHTGRFDIPGVTTSLQYEGSTDIERARGTLSALGQFLGERRLLSPAESVNGITIGAANLDAVSGPDRRLARVNIDPFPNLIISNPSSALGPGFARSVKPEILMPGGKEHLSVVSSGTSLSVKPSSAGRAHGLKVAAPPRGGLENFEHFTGGTSAATALASRTCHQIYDALELEYGLAFTSLSHAHKATLLKALLVHTASWPQDASSLLKQVFGPADNRLHVRQKDNIRRFLGYGLADPEASIACADDRATFWASGTLPRDQEVKIKVPIPVCINGKSGLRSLQETLAWFTPVMPGRQSYRAVRLVITESDELSCLRVEPTKSQPDINQGRRGTVFSRRWEGTKAPIIPLNQHVTLTVQRSPDQGPIIDEPIPFSLAVTFSMVGVTQIYQEVRDRLAVAPRTQVPQQLVR